MDQKKKELIKTKKNDENNINRVVSFQHLHNVFIAGK